MVGQCNLFLDRLNLFNRWLLDLGFLFGNLFDGFFNFFLCFFLLFGDLFVLLSGLLASSRGRLGCCFLGLLLLFLLGWWFLRFFLGLSDNFGTIAVKFLLGEKIIFAVKPDCFGEFFNLVDRCLEGVVPVLVWIFLLFFQHALQFGQIGDDPGAVLIVAHSVLSW